MPGKLVWKYVMYIVLELGVGSFFIGGVLVGHSGIVGRKLEFIGIRRLELVFLL